MSRRVNRAVSRRRLAVGAQIASDSCSSIPARLKFRSLDKPPTTSATSRSSTMSKLRSSDSLLTTSGTSKSSIMSSTTMSKLKSSDNPPTAFATSAWRLKAPVQASLPRRGSSCQGPSQLSDPKSLHDPDETYEASTRAYVKQAWIHETREWDSLLDTIKQVEEKVIKPHMPSVLAKDAGYVRSPSSLGDNEHTLGEIVFDVKRTCEMIKSHAQDLIEAGEPDWSPDCDRPYGDLSAAELRSKEAAVKADLHDIDEEFLRIVPSICEAIEKVTMDAQKSEEYRKEVMQALQDSSLLAGKLQDGKFRSKSELRSDAGPSPPPLFDDLDALQSYEWDQDSVFDFEDSEDEMTSDASVAKKS